MSSNNYHRVASMIEMNAVRAHLKSIQQ